MDPAQASSTANRTAAMRAAHQVFDAPRVLDDPLALSIIGTEAAAAIRAAPEKFGHPLARGLRAFLVARSRYAEDELAAAVGRGVAQYVILGAGLDTFAYRNPFPGLRVFEVDHPATQERKRRLLAEAEIPVPPSLTWVPADFEHRQLTDQLRRTGFMNSEPAFFSWLGVTMYLEHDSIRRLLADVASPLCSNSIVFDYALNPASLSAGSRAASQRLAERAAAFGEPWKSFFDPGQLVAELKAVGFRSVEDIGPETLNARYFGNRSDGLEVGSARLMKATT